MSKRRRNVGVNGPNPSGQAVLDFYLHVLPKQSLFGRSKTKNKRDKRNSDYEAKIEAKRRREILGE